MGLKTTSFNIEEKDYELLKDKAFLMKKRVSDILRDLVSDFIKVEKTEQEKSKEKIKNFVESYPLCEKCRIVQIA